MQQRITCCRKYAANKQKIMRNKLKNKSNSTQTKWKWDTAMLFPSCCHIAALMTVQ